MGKGARSPAEHGPVGLGHPAQLGAIDPRPPGRSQREFRGGGSGWRREAATPALLRGQQSGKAAGVCLPAPRVGEEGQANGWGGGEGHVSSWAAPGSHLPRLQSPVPGRILARNPQGDARRRLDPPPTAPSPFSGVWAPKFWREGTPSSPETEPGAGRGAGQRGQRSLRARKTPISAIRRNKRHAGFGVTPWYVPADR